MKEEQKLIKRDLQEAVWIGEDGAMAIDGRFSERYAWIQFRKLMRDDVGEYEADEVEIEDVGIGYFHLPTPEDIEEYGNEYDWLINYQEKSDYPVWVYRS